MARITIVGGHGKVALLTHPLLTDAGHEVRALIRNLDHANDVLETGATPVLADVENLEVGELTALFTGSDIVIWSAGAGGGDPARTTAVDHHAAVRSIDAADAAGVDRYIMVSYFDARPDHGIAEDEGFYAYAEAKAAADAHLRDSDLSWTILGPSGLTLDEPTGQIETATGLAVHPGENGELAGSTVTRADVAAVIAEVVARIQDDPGALAGVFLRFNNGTTPIPEALRAIVEGAAPSAR